MFRTLTLLSALAGALAGAAAAARYSDADLSGRVTTATGRPVAGALVTIGTGAADAVLRFDPATERFTVYPLPIRGALVRHMAVDPRTGDLWAAYGASPGIPPKILRVRVEG